MYPLVRFPACPLTVTVTVTAPALPAGVVAVILCHSPPLRSSLPSHQLLPSLPPAKFVPVIVTAVPPAVGPLFGDTLLLLAPDQNRRERPP